jgi:outer membrane lipoprotein SlyB
VVEARSSGRLSKPAFLSVAITRIQAGGSWVDVNTHPVTLEGKSHKKRDVVAIGGGSALGALIGGIAGGGKGAAIGAGAGAGAGTAGAALTGKKEISLPAESHLTFRLSRSVTVGAQ